MVMSKIIPTFAPQSGHVTDFYVIQHILTQFIHLTLKFKTMKKFFSLIAAVLFAGSMVAEELLFEQTYPGSPSEFVSAYSKTFTITTDGYTLSYANINNGKESDNWDAVRAGSKNGASVASVTSAVIAGKVSKVIVNFTQVQAAKTNELYLQVADNAEFTGATKIGQTIAVGAVVFEVAEPAENMFYKIVLDQAQGSANGFNRWDRIQFVSPDGEGTIDPPTQETIKATVAEAIEAGMALETGKTSTEVYEVTGFVVNAEAYSTQHKNQIWWMADDAENTGAQEFEAYACTVSEDNVTMQVLNGDKVTLTGKITKYNDTKKSKIIIEIKNGTAVFVSKAEGDHSIGGDTPPATDLDTITVAKALEIGGQLPSGGKTDVQYVIEGYVSNIVTYYDPASDFETFWMMDEKGGRGASNADKAFEVYKGNPIQKMTTGLDGHVFVTAKITNYNGSIIETSGTAVVNIVEQGSVDEVEAITVAKALELGEALADKGTTEKRYEITGYVANVYNFLNPDYGSETLWITDDPESTSTENAFQIYRGKPSTKTATGLHAKVKVVTKIKKYGSTIETDGSTIPFEVLEASTFVPDTVDIDKAVEIAEALGENAKTPVYYVVKGFIQEPGTFDSQNSNATFKLSQFPNETEGPVTAYRATVLKADAEKVATKNSYVNVTGYLMKKGGAQIAQGAITAFVEAPDMDTIHVSVAEALAIGTNLPIEGKSDRIYAVTGFVNNVDEPFAEGVETFYMADDAASEAMNFLVLDVAIEAEAPVGQKVEVVGRLQNADGETVTIENGKARLLWPEGIESIVLTEKAQKVVVDGVIYIVRDNKLFNLQGAQVR